MSREEKTDLTEEQLSTIRRYPSLPRVSFPERSGFQAWGLLVIIPLSLIGVVEGREPKTLLGNFYKCADETETPHYLSWSPIHTETPDFHRPEFFGELYL